MKFRLFENQSRSRPKHVPASHEDTTVVTYPKGSMPTTSATQQLSSPWQDAADTLKQHLEAPTPPPPYAARSLTPSRIRQANSHLAMGLRRSHSPAPRGVVVVAGGSRPPNVVVTAEMTTVKATHRPPKPHVQYDRRLEIQSSARGSFRSCDLDTRTSPLESNTMDLDSLHPINAARVQSSLHNPLWVLSENGSRIPVIEHGNTASQTSSSVSSSLTSSKASPMDSTNKRNVWENIHVNYDAHEYDDDDEVDTVKQDASRHSPIQELGQATIPMQVSSSSVSSRSMYMDELSITSSTSTAHFKNGRLYTV